MMLQIKLMGFDVKFRHVWRSLGETGGRGNEKEGRR